MAAPVLKMPKRRFFYWVAFQFECGPISQIGGMEIGIGEAITRGSQLLAIQKFIADMQHVEVRGKDGAVLVGADANPPKNVVILSYTHLRTGKE